MWYNVGKMKEMKTFQMIRNNDESGVSGTGTVLDGVQFHTGQVVTCWHGDKSSVGVYDSFDVFWRIHVASHPTNNTEVHWSDGAVTRQRKSV